MPIELELTIAGLVYNQNMAGTYGLVLTEIHGNRRFSVMIGESEAQSIAMKLNNKRPPRPLTHDLINNILLSLQAKLEKILIYNMVNDVFYSELHILQNNETKLILDARTSDAVALAVRCNAPIYISADILQIVGTEVESTAKPNDFETNLDVNAEEMTNEEMDMLSISNLNELLRIAIEEEKYELAARIRDVISLKSA